MKVKIVDKGFAGLTGLMGSVYFEDGISEEISTAEAERLGCILAIETLEGHNPSSTQRLLDTSDQSYEEIIAKAPTKQKKTKAKAEKQEEVKEPVPVAPPADLNFTREQLEELADKEGITGLRNIGTQFGIKGRSIVEIIDELMAMQSAVKSKE